MDAGSRAPFGMQARWWLGYLLYTVFSRASLPLRWARHSARDSLNIGKGRRRGRVMRGSVRFGRFLGELLELGPEASP